MLRSEQCVGPNKGVEGDGSDVIWRVFRKRMFNPVRGLTLRFPTLQRTSFRVSFSAFTSFNFRKTIISPAFLRVHSTSKTGFRSCFFSLCICLVYSLTSTTWICNFSVVSACVCKVCTECGAS